MSMQRSITFPTGRRLSAASVALTTLLFAGGTFAGEGSPAPNDDPPAVTASRSVRDGSTSDALAFFQRLVQRYRSLHRYSEEAEVEQVTEDPATAGPPIRTRARVRAEVDDQELTVESSSLADVVDDALRPPADGASDAELWMLPHLRLRFDEEPMETFRPAARTPFRASELDRVRVDDRELVRVELLSGETGAPDAKFSLYVDPDRMLVERVEGDEWLPGGLRHRTTVRIGAQEVHEDRPAEPAVVEPATIEDEAVPAAPTDGPPAAVLSGPLG